MQYPNICPIVCIAVMQHRNALYWTRKMQKAQEKIERK